MAITAINKFPVHSERNMASFKKELLFLIVEKSSSIISTRALWISDPAAIALKMPDTVSPVTDVSTNMPMMMPIGTVIANTDSRRKDRVGLTSESSQNADPIEMPSKNW